MGLSAIIFLAVILIVAVYAIQIYNHLVRLKHNVTRAWSNIDVVLKQRHDELPKLVEVCKQYMGYERDTLERVVRARSAVADASGRGDLRALGLAEAELRSGVGRLFALAENYPDLKANANFQHLSQRVSQLEETIADRRELYNDSANLNNVRIEQFPDVLVARFMKAKSFDLLEFKEARENPDLRALFG